jgi:L-fuconate dehydratase
VILENGRYLAPRTPGFSAEMRPQILVDYCYPAGSVWAAEQALAEAVSPLPSAAGSL